MGAAASSGAGVQSYEDGKKASAGRWEHRKGSIAAFMPDAEDQKSEMARGWEQERRNPIATEHLCPERWRAGRQACVVTFPKEIDDTDVIAAALREHPLFSYLQPQQIAEIASVLVPVEYAAGSVVYYSWEKGQDVFLIKRGSVRFTQTSENHDIAEPVVGAERGRRASVTMLADGPKMSEDDGDEDGVVLSAGAMFGELAGLWGARRGFTATTIGVTSMFTINREALRRSLTFTAHAGRKGPWELLRPVKLLAELAALPRVQLDAIELAAAGLATHLSFDAGDKIFTQGSPIEGLIVIASGEVQLATQAGGEAFLVLGRGDYAGEVALARPGLVWSASATATQRVEVVSISRAAFRQLLPSSWGDEALAPADIQAYALPARPAAAPPASGELQSGPIHSAAVGELPAELAHECYAEFQKVASVEAPRPSALNRADDASGTSTRDTEFADHVSSLRTILQGKALKASDFDWCCNLAQRERLVGTAYWAGGGSTSSWRGTTSAFLAKHKSSGKMFAVRVYDKAHVWSNNGLEQMQAEHRVLKSAQNKRLLAMLAWFQDPKCVYYVFDAVLGTSAWALMQNQRFKALKEDHARHYVAQVVSALKYVHGEGMVHRCIHPEALLVDSRGWLRLGCSMFMRQSTPGRRQWTLCGVPEYIAPEVIQGVGHGRMADFWALGILIHELSCGRTPYYSDDPLDGMRRILLNERKMLAQDASRDLVEALLQIEPHRRLGYNACGSRAAALASLQQVAQHAWFKDLNWDDIEHERGDVPHVPPAVPVDELGRQVELAPGVLSVCSSLQRHLSSPQGVEVVLSAHVLHRAAHPKSGFLHDPKESISAGEQEVFVGW